MDELTARKRDILRAVVIEYLNTAEPVGSSLIVARYQLGVGSATVRHELADMSERGYLEQPHTSAGRIPSDTGYRYYVDRIAEPHVEPEQRRQVQEISRADADLQDLLAETCRILSRLTEYVSVAATVRERGVTVRGISLGGVTRERALLAVVLSNGMVENRIVAASPEITLSDLHEVSVLMTNAAEDARLKALSRLTAPSAEHLKPAARELMANAWRALRSLARSISTGKTIVEGAQHLFRQPEFQQDVETLSNILHVLEDETALQAALPSGDSGTAVLIGKENPHDALQKLAVISSRFYLGDEEAGTISVVGPTRMRYVSTIPLVQTAAKALTEALNRLMR